jgi:hypothetical protein
MGGIILVINMWYIVLNNRKGWHLSLREEVNEKVDWDSEK